VGGYYYFIFNNIQLGDSDSGDDTINLLKGRLRVYIFCRRIRYLNYIFCRRIRDLNYILGILLRLINKK